MEFLQQSFTIRFDYKVFFTHHLFDRKNELLRTFFQPGSEHQSVVPKVLLIIDEGFLRFHQNLLGEVREYFASMRSVRLVDQIVYLPGGESVKNTTKHFDEIIRAVHEHGIDRHSYIMAIGGGSVLDVAGYASAVAHRGIRHIRVPTTVLSQNDSGVGVKNGINFFNKKNFLGTFATPWAVFNDFKFLTSLDDAEWRAGTSEAVKVALIKDKVFFEWLEDHAVKIVQRHLPSMEYLIKRCAELHLQHIASLDPFETGSSRPLDFGHWSAHKLEQMSNFTIRHGEAVAVGIALDSVYSCLTDRLSVDDMKRVLLLIQNLGLNLTHPLLQIRDESSPLLAGLNEFREHLGGRLTIMLLNGIGKGEEVNTMDIAKVREANQWLNDFEKSLQQPV